MASERLKTKTALTLIQRIRVYNQILRDFIRVATPSAPASRQIFLDPLKGALAKCTLVAVVHVTLNTGR